LLKTYNTIKLGKRNGAFLKNTVLNLTIKGGVFILNFLSIPILYNLLKEYYFGFWEISFVIITNAMILDFGLGNTLRNLIITNITKNKRQKTNQIISVTFLLLIYLALTLLIVLLFFTLLFKKEINNLPKEIFLFWIITGVFFLINIVLSVFNSIANALQKSYLISVYSLFQSLSFVGLLLVFKLMKINNLLISIVISYNVTLFLCNVLLGFHLWKHNSWLKFTLPKGQLNRFYTYIVYQSKSFALVQFLTILLFSSDAIIIGYIYSMNDVASYTILNKVFFYITTIFSIILIQLWNSSADAFARNDIHWIKTIHKRLQLLLIPVIVLIIIINIYTDEIFKFWIGSEFKVDKKQMLLLSIYTIFNIWTAIYVNILNGIGHLKQQINAYILANILLMISIIMIFLNNLNIYYFIIIKTLLMLIILIWIRKSYNYKIGR